MDGDEYSQGHGQTPNVIKCPNCEEESLKQNRKTKEWVCANCGYRERNEYGRDKEP